jgi:polyhydroxybutyrate depolymerase
LNKLQSELCIDPDRIYAAGFSNGGGMTGILACTMAQRIAAFASVSGSYYPLPHGCTPGRAVSILEFHGTADRTVPYTGRPQLHELSTLDWLQGWAKLDGCLKEPHQVSSSAGVTVLKWSDCQDGAIIIHYRINGGSHTWPGGPGEKRIPVVDQTINASQVIWVFFAMHPLPVAHDSTTAD